MLLDLRSLDEVQGASNTGAGTSGQGGQTDDAVGGVRVRPPVFDGSLTPHLVSIPIQWGRTIRPRDIAGDGQSGQGGQTTAAVGSVRNIPAVAGEAHSSQAAATVIAIGAVDNSRPMKIRRTKQIAALLLLAA